MASSTYDEAEQAVMALFEDTTSTQGATKRSLHALADKCLELADTLDSSDDSGETTPADEENPHHVRAPENPGAKEDPAPSAQGAAQGFARVWSGDGITSEDHKKAAVFLNESGVKVIARGLTGPYHYKTNDGRFEVVEGDPPGYAKRLTKVFEDGIEASFTFTSLADANVYVHDRMQGKPAPAPNEDDVLYVLDKRWIDPV